MGLKDKIFERYYINLEKAEKVCNDLSIKRKELTSYSKQIDIGRKDEIKEMRRIRSLYSNKKRLFKDDFEFNSFKEFYEWYIGQYKKQEGACYYCETKESVIAELFKAKFTSAKRKTRGAHLEVERKDAKGNKYNKENCVLACYFCNNDKSDIFSEKEYFEYLKDRKLFFNNELKTRP